MSILRKIELLPIYALFISTWLIAGGGKLLGEGVPDGFRERFASTFISQFPGTTVAFYKIAILEVIAGLVFVVSLARREFLAKGAKPWLQWGMFLSLSCFVMLGFGLRLAGDNAGAASLFYYVGATLVAWIWIDRR